MVYIFHVLFSVISWLLKLALRLWEPPFRWVLLSTAGPRCCSVQTSADRLQVKLSKHIVGTTIRSRSPISVFEGEVAACEQNFSELFFLLILIYETFLTWREVGLFQNDLPSIRWGVTEWVECENDVNQSSEYSDLNSSEHIWKTVPKTWRALFKTITKTPAEGIVFIHQTSRDLKNQYRDTGCNITNGPVAW